MRVSEQVSDQASKWWGGVYMHVCACYMAVWLEEIPPESLAEKCCNTCSWLVERL